MTISCRRCLLLLVVSLVTVGPGAWAAGRDQAGVPPRALTIVSAGPEDEVASLAEANEIRVVFSEPMVTLGRIPAVVQAPFFEDHAGHRRHVPVVRNDDPDLHARSKEAAAVRDELSPSRSIRPQRQSAAESWPKPYTFSFTTPTVRLLQNADWYRRNGRFDQPIVVLLRFNQPVRPANVLAHLRARFEPHEWEAARPRGRRAEPPEVDRSRGARTVLRQGRGNERRRRVERRRSRCA